MSQHYPPLVQPQPGQPGQQGQQVIVTAQPTTSNPCKIYFERNGSESLKLGVISGTNASTQAAAKAGAYGGSEVGALIGGAVGPPVIGGIVGNLVGEKLGEKAVDKTGIGSRVGRARDKLGNVIGNENVDKVGEITLVALGYADDETCLCCPCMAASQLMLFVMISFSIFIYYRLGLGISWESGCEGDKVNVVTVSNEDLLEDPNDFYKHTIVDENVVTNTTTFLISYPCEYGFHYMVVGAAVWTCFLPFHIFTLLGNCWRQCCCCLCDPLVCCATVCDLMKRYLCECGRFSCIALVWYSMCIFQIVWGLSGLYWLVKTYYFSETGKDFMEHVPTFETFLEATTASVFLDLFLAGSEIVHKLRSVYNQKQAAATRPQAYEMHQSQP